MTQEIDRIKGKLTRICELINGMQSDIEIITSETDDMRKRNELMETLISTKGVLDE